MGITKQNKAGSSSHSLPREDTPLLSTTGKPVVLSSQLKTFANVFISIVGAGVLGLPYTFMRTGWLTSLIMVFTVSILTFHGMMLLVRTRKKLDDSSACSSAKIASFGDLGFAVCGSIGRSSVDLMIVLSQAGFCVGYLIFIGTTLANLFGSPSMALAAASSTNPKGFSAKSVYIWGCLPFQLGLNSIPSLTLLAPLSIFADFVDLAAMGLVMVEDAVKFTKHMPPVEAFGTIHTFFYGLGVAVYSFEGVGMALPLESEMKDKSKFGRILALTMVFIAALYGAFATMGYFAYGADTKDIITANMGTGTMSTLVQLGLCINLFFTFPLMMHPVYEVFERTFWEGRYCIWLRWLLVLAVSLISLFVPNFADFLSLVGSSTCCVLGFVLPGLFHYLTFKHEMSMRQAGFDVGVMLLGVFLGVSGTWFSLKEIFSVKV